MPSTIREIADACGVSKPTVTKYLKELGLWDFHVTPGDSSHPTVVDDEARAAVSQRLASIRGKAPAQSSANHEQMEADGDGVDGAPQKGTVALYEARIADLKAQILDLQGRLDAESSEREALTDRMGTMAEAMRALPSAEDVERARADGEAAGAEGERSKLAAMGFWARRRYLRKK